jgi:hypothetical protein
VHQGAAWRDAHVAILDLGLDARCCLPDHLCTRSVAMEVKKKNGGINVHGTLEQEPPELRRQRNAS